MRPRKQVQRITGGIKIAAKYAARKRLDIGPQAVEVQILHLLGNRGLGLLREIWHWREKEAREANRPLFHIMNPKSMIELADAIVKRISEQTERLRLSTVQVLILVERITFSCNRSCPGRIVVYYSS